MNLPALLLQLILLLLLAPLMSGLINNWKAKLQNRRGPRLWQPYADIIKFFRKDMVISEHASWVFSFAPYVVFVSALLAGLMVPMLTTQAPLSLFGGVLDVGQLGLRRQPVVRRDETIALGAAQLEHVRTDVLAVAHDQSAPVQPQEHWARRPGALSSASALRDAWAPPSDDAPIPFPSPSASARARKARMRISPVLYAKAWPGQAM